MADLTLTGVISEVLPVQSGTSKSGNEWKKQTFVVEETYQKNDGSTGINTVAFELFGEDKINNFSQYNKVGDKVEIKGSVRSNRYEKDGKVSYFTSASSWRIDKLNESTPNTEYKEPVLDSGTETDSLPF